MTTGHYTVNGEIYYSKSKASFKASESKSTLKWHFYDDIWFDLSENSKKDIFAKREGKVFCRVEPRHKRELVKILIELVRRFVSIMIFLG